MFLPKNSGVQRARSLSEYLDATLAIVDHEEIDGVRQEGYVIGNVAGKNVFLLMTFLNTGQTLATAAEVLMKMVRKKCMLAPRMVCYQKAQKQP